MRPIHVIPTLGALAAAGALAATAGAQSSFPQFSGESNKEEAGLVAEAIAEEAEDTKAATLLKRKSFEAERSGTNPGEYTVRIKRKGTGPTILSDKAETAGGSFAKLEVEPRLTSSGTKYLKALRKRSSTKLTFQVQVTFDPSDGGKTVKVTEDYSQRIKG